MMIDGWLDPLISCLEWSIIRYVVYVCNSCCTRRTLHVPLKLRCLLAVCSAVVTNRKEGKGPIVRHSFDPSLHNETWNKGAAEIQEEVFGPGELQIPHQSACRSFRRRVLQFRCFGALGLRRMGHCSRREEQSAGQLQHLLGKRTNSTNDALSSRVLLHLRATLHGKQF